VHLQEFARRLKWYTAENKSLVDGGINIETRKKVRRRKWEVTKKRTGKAQFVGRGFKTYRSLKADLGSRNQTPKDEGV